MISVVIPFYNEEESLAELHRQLVHELAGHASGYEIVLIDDGSRDGSWAVVAGLAAAAALAFVLSRVNPVFNHTRELELVTGREVLGVVSLTNLEQVQAEERQGYRRFAFAGGGLAVAFVAALLLSRSLPGAFLWP